MASVSATAATTRASSCVPSTRHLQAVKTPAQKVIDTPRLSRCEMRVLLYTALGLSTPETAEVLSRSPETIKSHRDSLMRKLGAKNMMHAIALSYEKGILKPTEYDEFGEVAKPGTVMQMEERLMARALADRAAALKSV